VGECPLFKKLPKLDELPDMVHNPLKINTYRYQARFMPIFGAAHHNRHSSVGENL
jgi:hypothetical protein